MSGYRQMIVVRDDKSRIGNIARLVSCAGRYWSSDNASTTGAALAFFCAFSLAPLLVILLTISTALSNVRAQVARQYAGIVGMPARVVARKTRKTDHGSEGYSLCRLTPLK
jgi:uncharacterized BrkB/YihY/UPF0761 family membrane protein